MYHHASVPPTYYASSSSEETNHQHHQYYYHTHNQQQQQQQQQQQPNALHSFKGPINNYSNSTSFLSFSETNTPLPTPTNHQHQHQHQQHYYNQSSSFLNTFDASSSSSGFFEQQQQNHHQANHIIVGVSPSTSSVRSNHQHQVNHNNNSTANVTATSPSSSSAASHNNSKRASKFPSFLLPSPRSTTSASSITAAGTNVANVSPVLRATAATNTTNSNDASSSTHEEQPSSLLHSSGTTSTSVPSSTSSLERQQRQMEEEERVKLCRLYNNTPFSKVANEYNLHGPVLSNKEGLLFVPYPTRYQYDFIISSQRDREQKQHQELRHLRSMTTDQNQNKEEEEEEEDDQHTSTFFLGRLPLIVNKEMIESLLRVIGGVIPISITITTAVKNAKGNYTSPLAMIVVRRCDEHRLLANIHRRVIFDQTGFQLAINEDQLFIMQRYCKMLARGRGRFQHRPFVPITVTKANPASLPKGHAPIHDNEYNPLCKCTACQDIFHKVSDYSLLFDDYLPKVVGDPYYYKDDKNDQTGEDHEEKQDGNHHEVDDDDDDDGTSSVFTATSTEFFLNGNAGKGSGLVKHFRLNRLIRTHAFRKIENLETDLEKHLYCDVSTKCLNECTGKALNHWPFYRYAVWDDDKVDFNCAAVVTANNYSKNNKK